MSDQSGVPLLEDIAGDHELKNLLYQFGTVREWDDKLVVLVHEEAVPDIEEMAASIHALLDDGSKGFILNGNQLNQETLITELAEHLNLPPLPNPNPDTIRRAVLAKLGLMAQRGNRFLLCITDAQNLDRGNLQLLFEMAAETSIKLVLRGHWRQNPLALHEAKRRGLLLHHLKGGGESQPPLSPAPEPAADIDIGVVAEPSPETPLHRATAWLMEYRVVTGMVIGAVLLSFVVIALLSPAPGDFRTTQELALPLPPAPAAATKDSNVNETGAAADVSEAPRQLETPAATAGTTVAPAPADPAIADPGQTDPVLADSALSDKMADPVLSDKSADSGAAPELSGTVEPAAVEPSAAAEASTALYTIQLIVFASEENRDRFLATAAAYPEVTSTTQRDADGNTRYHVSYGAFDSLREAQAAVANLPKELKVGQPYINPLQQQVADAP